MALVSKSSTSETSSIPETNSTSEMDSACEMNSVSKEVSHPKKEYTGTHLIDIATEIRLNIWRLLYDDVLCGLDDDTYEQRAAPWSGLLLTSRKIRAEVRVFWPRTLIPYHHSSELTQISSNRLINVTTGLSKSLSRDFRYLNIQLPNRPSPGFLVQVAHGLKVLRNILQGLSISFVGDDAYGTKTGYYGCGLENDVPAQILPPKGACHKEKDAIIKLVEELTQLRKLKLANFNRPIFRHQIGYKPHLNILDLTCDSRAQQYKFDATGCAIEWQPPKALKKLTLSANAILGAVNIARRAMPTLEELTYLIPSSRWQLEKSLSDYMTDAGHLFKAMAELGGKLRRFRLCLEGPETEWYAIHLLDGIRQWLPLTRLHYLEIHANFNSPFFGRELIQALPRSLRHLHVSLELVDIEILRIAVAERYFGVGDADNFQNGHHAAGYLERITYPCSQQEAIKMDLLRLNGALTDRARNTHLFEAYKDYYPRFGGFATDPNNFEMDRLNLAGKPGLHELTVNDLTTWNDDGTHFEEERKLELPEEVRMTLYRPPKDYLNLMKAETTGSTALVPSQQHYHDPKDCRKMTQNERDFYMEEPPRAQDLISLLAPEPVNDDCAHQHWTI